MRELVRSSVTTSIAMAAAGAVAVTPAVITAAPQAPPAVMANVHLTAASSPPPGALVEQFLVNQIDNCSKICPFILQGAVQVPVTFAIIPITFAQELASGTPLLRAIASTDATVSGAAKNAIDGIINNDLGLVLPRAQHALEVAVVGLIDVGTTAVTRPANILPALDTARTDFFVALTQPLGSPGSMPPAVVHNQLEAAAVRTIEVASAITFQAPERLLQGAGETADAFFRTVGQTGDIGAGVGAAGGAAAKAINDSVAFVRHAATEKIPIQSAALQTKTPKALTSGTTHTVVKTKPFKGVRKLDHALHKAFQTLNKATHHHAEKKSAK
jgi:hypothetical protein